MRTAAATETCFGLDTLLLQSLIGEATGRDALAPAGRPIRQRRWCRRRWLLRPASDSHARLQVTANRAASKHLGVSGNYGKLSLASTRRMNA